MNAAERKSIRAAEKAAREAEQERVNFVVAAMSTKQGRSWFYGILEFCSVFSDPYYEDQYYSNLRKGQRSIGLMVYNDIVTNCPDYFLTMMAEAKLKEQANDRRTSVPTDDYDGTADDEFAGGEDVDG